MDETLRLTLIVVLMALVTYLPRSLPLQFDFSNWPPVLRDAIEFLPVSVIAAMIVPPIVESSINGSHGTHMYTLWIAVTTFGSAVLTRNLLLTVLIGTGLHFLMIS